MVITKEGPMNLISAFVCFLALRVQFTEHSENRQPEFIITITTIVIASWRSYLLN